MSTVRSQRRLSRSRSRFPQKQAIATVKIMNLLKVGFVFASVLFAVSVHAERGIAEIFQPTSLLGTESDDEPLKDGQIMAATILSRPILVAGAFPESPVAAMCLPHKITGATAGFPEES